MTIYLRLEAPYEWVRVNGRRVEAFGEVPDIESYSIQDDDQVVGIIPGEWVTAHKVDLPAKTRKQFNQALPYALEESISEDVSNIHFVCPEWKAGETVTVLSVAKKKMLEWQALATKYQLPVDQLLPDHALVPFHEAADCSIAVTQTGTDGAPLLANRRDGMAMNLDPEFLDIWLMDLPMSSTIAINDEPLTETLIQRHPDRDFRFWGFGHRLAHWLEYPVAANMDLWGDRFRPRVSRFTAKALLIPAMLAIAALLLPMCYDVYRYVSLKSEITALDTKSLEVLRDSFPDVQGITGGEARTFMERAIQGEQLRLNERGFTQMFTEVARILKRQNVSLSEVSYRDKTLTITCNLSDFSQVDALNSQFNRNHSLIASLEGSSANDGQVNAVYQIKQK